MINNIPSNIYVYQFNSGDYLSWFEVTSHYTFGRTSSITQAAMFENTKDVPEWIIHYLGGNLIHINMEVTSND